MTISILIGASTPTTQAITLSGRAGVQPELQLATNPDFARCVAPMFPVANQNAHTLGELNQGTTYYLRGRNIAADGSRDGWSPIYGFRTPTASPRAASTANIRVDKAIIVPKTPILAMTSMPSVAGYPAGNMLRAQPVAWRAIKTGAQFWFNAYVGGAPIDTIALLQTNLPEGASVVIRADNDQAAFGSDTAAFSMSFPAFRASANMPGRPGYHGLFRLPSPQVFGWWAVDIFASLPGDMLHAEHFIMGLNRATKAAAIDQKMSAVPLGSLERSRSGLIDAQRGITLRREEFEIAMLNEHDFEENLSDIWRKTNEPMLVAPNSLAGPYLHDRLLYGDFVGGAASRTSSTRFSRSFIVESLI